uniref:Doublecortin domain-containing protein n=1 Tax=Meloidogyne javanica TaxID=6303 RepID=A0A915NAY5_MELJA
MSSLPSIFENSNVNDNRRNSRRHLLVGVGVSKIPRRASTSGSLRQRPCHETSKQTSNKVQTSNKARASGVRVPINKGRFRTMDALMDSLNDSIPMPFGVRRLHTPNGKTPIRSLDELQPHGRYIAASSTRRVQGVDLEAVERRKRHREDAQRRWNFQSSPSTTTHGGSANTAQIPSSKGGAGEINNTHQDNTNMFQSSQVGRASRSRSEKLPAPEASNALSTQQRVNSTFMPVTSKQIYFVLNGNPHRFYRTLVSPLSRGELDHLLEEISEGLQTSSTKRLSRDCSTQT